MHSLFANIYAEGQVVNNEQAYVQAELEVAFMDTVRAYGMLASRVTTYAEEETKGGEGFFSKISNFIRTLINKIVEFVKKLARKTMEIISKPFGTKMKAANNASGGGGSNNRTETTSKDSGSGTVNTITAGTASNLFEINNLIKKSLQYIKTNNKELSNDELFKNMTIVARKYNPANFDQIYKESDWNNVLATMRDHVKFVVADAGRLGTVYQTKGASDADTTTLLEDLEKGDVTMKIHPSGVVKVEYLAEEGYRDQMITTLQVGSQIIQNSLSSLSTFANSLGTFNNKNIEEKAKGAVAELIAIPSSARSNKNCGNYKVFGIPANEADGVYRLALIAAGGKDVMDLVNSEVKSFIESSKTNISQFNIKTISQYSGMLVDKPVLAKDFKASLFKVSTISAGDNFKDVIAKKLHRQSMGRNFDTVLTKLTDVIKILEDVDKDYNKKDKDTGKSGADKYGDNIKMEKLDSAKVVKEYVGVAGKIVRNLGNQTIPFLADVKYIHDSIQSNPVMNYALVSANTLLWTWDSFTTEYARLSKELDNKSFTDKVFDGDAEKIKKAKYDLTKIKEDTIKVVSDAFGAAAQ